MISYNSLTKQDKQENIVNPSQESIKVLKLLDEIEEFTINIGKKMMNEMKSKGKNIHINLNDE